MKSKYSKLCEYLTDRNELEIKLTFNEIEEIIDSELPISAKNENNSIWWSNNDSYGGHVQSKKGWLKAGFKVDRILIHRKEVIFKKIDKNGTNNNDLTWRALLKRLNKSIYTGMKLEKNKNKKYGYIEEICFGNIKMRTGIGKNGLKSINYDNLKFLFERNCLDYKKLKKEYENKFGQNSTDCRFSNSITLLKKLGVKFNF